MPRCSLRLRSGPHRFAIRIIFFDRAELRQYFSGLGGVADRYD